MGELKQRKILFSVCLSEVMISQQLKLRKQNAYHYQAAFTMSVKWQVDWYLGKHMACTTWPQAPLFRENHA